MWCLVMGTLLLVQSCVEGNFAVPLDFRLGQLSEAKAFAPAYQLWNDQGALGSACLFINGARGQVAQNGRTSYQMSD